MDCVLIRQQGTISRLFHSRQQILIDDWIDFTPSSHHWLKQDPKQNKLYGAIIIVRSNVDGGVNSRLHKCKGHIVCISVMKEEKAEPRRWVFLTTDWKIRQIGHCSSEISPEDGGNATPKLVQKTFFQKYYYKMLNPNQDVFPNITRKTLRYCH